MARKKPAKPKTKKAPVKARPARRAAPPPSDRRVVAVTGDAGFLGGGVLHMLDEDPRYERLIMLDVKRPAEPVKKGKFYKVDLTQATADSTLAEIFSQEKVDVVVHCAYLQSPVLETSYAHELEAIGTLYVLNAAAECDIPKVVVPSTTAVYGATPSNPNYLAEDAPLQARGDRLLEDRVEIERQLATHRRKHPGRVVTVLRPCLTLGPRVRNWATRYLSQPVVSTAMGYDPLMQFVHEDDVLRALKLAVDEDHSGVFNIVGRGVLPLSTLLRLGGKPYLPAPASLLYPATNALWLAGLSTIPAAYLDYFRWLFVADGARAAHELGFEAKYTTKETFLNFMGMLRLRRFRLAGEGANASNRVHQRKRRVL